MCSYLSTPPHPQIPWPTWHTKALAKCCLFMEEPTRAGLSSNEDKERCELFYLWLWWLIRLQKQWLSHPTIHLELPTCKSEAHYCVKQRCAKTALHYQERSNAFSRIHNQDIKLHKCWEAHIEITIQPWWWWTHQWVVYHHPHRRKGRQWVG
jgi:hypothetical protein